jgi:hypothetical protein
LSTSYTPNTGLGIPAPGDRAWNVPLSADLTLLDGLVALAAGGVQLTEVPSASLNVKIAPAAYLKQNGTIGTYAGVSSTAMTASSTNYLYLDLTAAGVLVVNTSGFPTTAHVRIGVVVAGSGTITSITDARVAYEVLGTFLDGTNWTFGTGSGTQIGTAANQKLGFFGATPIAQPGATTDLRQALINLGLLLSGGASPLNLNGGALTVGSASVADGGNVAVGTSTGTQIGTATNQKLGFFGKTPAVQPTMGSATAGSSWTSNEQAMLNAVYAAIRALGLGS